MFGIDPEVVRILAMSTPDDDDDIDFDPNEFEEVIGRLRRLYYGEGTQPQPQPQPPRKDNRPKTPFRLWGW